MSDGFYLFERVARLLVWGFVTVCGAMVVAVGLAIIVALIHDFKRWLAFRPLLQDQQRARQPRIVITIEKEAE